MKIKTLATILSLMWLLNAAIRAFAVEPSSAVTFIPAATVQTAFDNGATLYSGDVNYRIEASRREHPGMVEIHHRDTDIIYVLEGSTTFVTGGEVIDAKSVAPDEVRGVSVNGGEAHHLAKGDVIIVPAGTPHWFKEVPAPFVYYVVKVR